MRDPKEIKEFKKMLEDRVVISKDGIAVFNKPDVPEKHTEEIEEIITKVPSWIVRWGITLLFSTILIVVAISVLVPYPEMVKYPLKLQSFSSSVPVIADTSGRITKVFIEKGMVVKKGQPLVEIQKSYVLKAPRDGRIGFSAIVQPGSFAGQNQEMFKIHPLNEQFYGVIYVSTNAINKIRVGQEVLIKLSGSSSADNNTMRGKVDFVADEPINNRFLVKVSFSDLRAATQKFEIKNWMEFDAQIITKKSNLFNRLFRSIIDKINIS
jgi:hypothetical protein